MVIVDYSSKDFADGGRTGHVETQGTARVCRSFNKAKRSFVTNAGAV